MSDQKKLLNRRQFLERAALVGAAALGAGALLSGCEAPEAEDEPTEPAADENGFSCNDEAALADLEEAQIEQRNDHQYTDASPEENEFCDNCAFWEEPAAGENCGGCQVLPGPFHPQGWCDLWTGA